MVIFESLNFDPLYINGGCHSSVSLCDRWRFPTVKEMYLNKCKIYIFMKSAFFYSDLNYGVRPRFNPILITKLSSTMSVLAIQSGLYIR